MTGFYKNKGISRVVLIFAKADFAAKGRFRNKRSFSQPISQLRNGGNCAAKWHSCAKRVLRSCENFRKEGPEAVK